MRAWRGSFHRFDFGLARALESPDWGSSDASVQARADRRQPLNAGLVPIVAGAGRHGQGQAVSAKHRAGTQWRRLHSGLFGLRTPSDILAMSSRNRRRGAGAARRLTTIASEARDGHRDGRAPAREPGPGRSESPLGRIHPYTLSCCVLPVTFMNHRIDCGPL